MRLVASLATGIAVAAIVTTLTRTQLPLPQRQTTRPPRPQPRWLLLAHAEGTSTLRLIGISGTLAATALVLIWAATGAALLAVVPAAATGSLPAAHYRARARRQDNERLRAWPDALRTLVATLQAGQSLHHSLVELSRSGPVPLRGTFARYEALTQHGLPEVRALQAVRTEAGDPVSDRTFEVLMLASAKGSRIALRILRDIADVTAADVQLAERIETAGLEQRLNARTVFILPWLTLILLCARPGPFRDYYASAAGARILIIGAGMSLTGMVIVRRLAHLPAEPRVLLHPNDPDRANTP